MEAPVGSLCKDITTATIPFSCPRRLQHRRDQPRRRPCGRYSRRSNSGNYSSNNAVRAAGHASPPQRLITPRNIIIIIPLPWAVEGLTAFPMIGITDHLRPLLRQLLEMDVPLTRLHVGAESHHLPAAPRIITVIPPPVHPGIPTDADDREAVEVIITMTTTTMTTILVYLFITKDSSSLWKGPKVSGRDN